MCEYIKEGMFVGPCALRERDYNIQVRFFFLAFTVIFHVQVSEIKYHFDSCSH